MTNIDFVQNYRAVKERLGQIQTPPIVNRDLCYPKLVFTPIAPPVDPPIQSFAGKDATESHIYAKKVYRHPIGPRLPRHGRVIYSCPAGPTYFGGQFKPLHKSQLTPMGIVEYVAKSYNISEDCILGKARYFKISNARQVAMYILRRGLKMGLKDIQGLLGRRDHAGVFYGVNRIEGRIARGELSDPLLVLFPERFK